jgi:CheY-like chemotaxis protein
MSSLLSDILEFFDYGAVGAQDGEEALTVLGKVSVDLVITDLKMPRMGGLDLLRTIKDKFPGLPVVVITGFGTDSSESDAGTDSSESDAYAAHADGFLAKPFKVDEIKGLLKKHLGYRD